MLSRIKYNFLNTLILRQLRVLVTLLIIIAGSYKTVANEQHKIDSVLTLLKADKADTLKVRHLDNICDYYYLSGNFALQIKYIDSLLALSGKINYPKGIAEAYENYGNHYLKVGNHDTALQFQFKALQIYKDIRDTNGMAITMGYIGNVYSRTGGFSKALKYYSDALNLCEVTGNKACIAQDNNGIGIIYAEEGDNTKALDYFLRSLKIDRELGDKIDIAMATGNIGIIYCRNGEYQKSIDAYLESLKMDEELGNNEGIATLEGNIGAVYNDLNEYEKALEYLQKALKMAEETGNKYLQMNNLTNIGNTYKFINPKDTIYLSYYYKALKIARDAGNKSIEGEILAVVGSGYVSLKEYKKALSYLNQAMLVCTNIGDLETLQNVYSLLSQVYSETGDWKNAYKMYAKSSELKDSLTSEEKTKEIGRLEAKADYDKQLALQKADEDKKSALAVAESKKQRILIFFIAAIALAVAIIAIIIFRSLKTVRNQKKLIEIQKMAAEQQKLLVEEKNTEIVDSINYAKRLQDAILPPLSEIKRFLPESFVLYKPKDIVAGDFYWMQKTQNTVFIAAADCTGHGVPGALVSVVCSNALNRAVKEFGITDTGKILDKVRELVLETFSQGDQSGEKVESDVKDGMDISLCSLSPMPAEKDGDMVIQWSGANRPFWYIQDGQLKELAPDKQPIGKADNPKPFIAHTINFPRSGYNSGVVLYLFTDGFADQFGGPKGKKFKFRQLQDTLLGIYKSGMQVQKEELEKVFAEWMGMLEQVDDVLIIGIGV